MILRLTPTQSNLIAGYLGNGLQAVLALAFLPQFLRLLGVEGYGLFGVFVLLQMLLVAFPQGLNSALTLEVARRWHVAGQEGVVLSLVGRLDRTAWISGVILGGLLAAAAPWIARDWLQAAHLTVGETIACLRWMGVGLAVQWALAVYSSVLMGMQRQIVLQGLQSASSLARYPGGVLLLSLFGADLTTFFQYQAAVAMLQALASRAVVMGPLRTAVRTPADWRGLGRAAMGLTAVIFPAILFVQVDRLYLSRAVPLESFARYALAATVAGALAVISSPVLQVLYPRFAQLRAQARADLARQLYFQSCEFTAALVAPVAATLIVFPGPTLLAWTGDAQLAASAGPILRWLAVGWGMHELIAAPTAILMAAGSRRTFAVLQGAAVAVLVLSMAWLTQRKGAEGAAWAWCLANIAAVPPISLLANRLVRGKALTWTAEVLVRAPLLSVLPVAIFFQINPPAGRWGLVLFLGGACASSMLLTWIGMPVTRDWTLSKLARRR